MLNPQRNLFDDETPELPASIRLFQPEERTPHAIGQLTLRECFERHLLPDLENPAPKTVEGYRTMLTLWESLTADPPVHTITRQTVRDFRKSLLKSPWKKGKKSGKRSPATVNKIMRTLSAAITPLWPADRHNSGGLDAVPFFKWPKPLAEDQELPFVFSAKEMSALYLACDACKGTGGYRRTNLYCSQLWRLAIVMALNAGPRTWDLFALRWSDIRLDDFRHGAIQYRARKTGKVQRVPLNKVTRAHLDLVRSMGLCADRVFPSFNKGRPFYRAWDRICQKAGVNAPFESFRKTCSTKHDDVMRGVGKWITGHATRGVNARFYQNPTNRILRAVYRLKNPAEFRRGAATIARAMKLQQQP